MRLSGRYKAIRISRARFLKCSESNSVEPRLDHDLRQTVTKRNGQRSRRFQDSFTRESVNGGVERTHERSCWAQTDGSPPHPRFSTYTYSPLAPPSLCSCHHLHPSAPSLFALPTQTREARKSRKGQGARVVLNKLFNIAIKRQRLINFCVFENLDFLISIT